ncbi:MAG TPA: GDSL-type esterase/lipase family protein [Geminicoccaceae bacterium]|nr:GDSL-type esterase/lipase family protein [Geminicoccaceae bacterium]
MALLLGSAALAADPCAAPAAVWGRFPPLAESGRSIAFEHTLTVVALGSSSTEGTGASAPAMAYPAQLDSLLQRRLPDVRVSVLNKGVLGETVAQNLARLERDALAHGPDLVIWQVGTNDAFQHVDPAIVASQLREGIARIKARGSDVVLMESQFFPIRPPPPELSRMIETVRAVGRDAGVTVLPRYALMRHWLEAKQLPAEALVGADGLHMTDASYHCLAERVADLFPTASPAPLVHPVAAGP